MVPPRLHFALCPCANRQLFIPPVVFLLSFRFFCLKALRHFDLAFNPPDLPRPAFPPVLYLLFFFYHAFSHSHCQGGVPTLAPKTNIGDSFFFQFLANLLTLVALPPPHPPATPARKFNSQPVILPPPFFASFSGGLFHTPLYPQH